MWTLSDSILNPALTYRNLTSRCTQCHFIRIMLSMSRRPLTRPSSGLELSAETSRQKHRYPRRGFQSHAPSAPGKTQGWVANLDFWRLLSGVWTEILLFVSFQIRVSIPISDWLFSFVSLLGRYSLWRTGPVCAQASARSNFIRNKRAGLPLLCVCWEINSPAMHKLFGSCPPHASFPPHRLAQRVKMSVWSPAQPPHRLRLPLTTARTGGGNPRTSGRQGVQRPLGWWCLDLTST